MQVKAASVSNTEKVYSLANAILLYKENGTPVFASVHDVEVKEGVPSIEAGTPVSKTALVEMLKKLVPEDYAPVELLQNHILAKGHDHLVWFSRPKKRQVWFKCKELGDVSAMTNHPGLVFVVTRLGWYVYAVKSRARPTASTPLYVAPYFNAAKNGAICVGNVETPKGQAKFNTEAWEEAYFRSYFTHPNIHEKGGLTKYRGGPFSLWRALMKGREFPTESLVPSGVTLGEVFERMVQHGRS